VVQQRPQCLDQSAAGPVVVLPQFVELAGDEQSYSFVVSEHREQPAQVDVLEPMHLAARTGTQRLHHVLGLAQRPVDLRRSVHRPASRWSATTT
jgi:hypothetical protein